MLRLLSWLILSHTLAYILGTFYLCTFMSLATDQAADWSHGHSGSSEVMETNKMVNHEKWRERGTQGGEQKAMPLYSKSLSEISRVACN